MRAMIFSAGLGTRLKPMTDTMPKALVPLGGKPLLQWQIEQLRQANISDIRINVHHFPDMIIDYLKEHNDFGCQITISDERDMVLETGGGLKKALQHDYDSPILACNVDILSNINISQLINQYNHTGESQLVVSHRTTQRYLCFDEVQHLCGWINLSTGEVKLQEGEHYAFSGMQILSPSALQRLEDIHEDKFSLIDFYLKICQQEKLAAYIPDNYRMMDVGKISQLSEAEQFAETLL